jgi:hypothetical protein
MGINVCAVCMSINVCIVWCVYGYSCVYCVNGCVCLSRLSCERMIDTQEYKHNFR